MKLLLLLCAFAIAYVAADKWVLLIAGSNTYSNYRHQSDICHAYQLLHGKGGIPEDHIVVMMYDDIANNPSNPVKGNLINKPNGPNVYTGVPKDYTGRLVNKQQFLAALSGDDQTTKGRKVIKSTADDEIFVFYSDHGASGLIAMPDGQYLYANELIPVLKKMSANNQFAKFTFYLEACESGSMFANVLPNNIRIYATTAANPDESSYAYYYDSKRKTYLGDEYSCHWMEDSDVADFDTETLQQQYQTVKNLTTTSHVMQYGQMDIAKDDLSEFMEWEKRGRWTGPLATHVKNPERVSSRDVTLALLEHAYQDANSVDEKLSLSQQIADEKAARALADLRFANIWTAVAGNRMLIPKLPHIDANAEWMCYKDAVEAFEQACGKLTDYSLKHAKVLATLCAEGFQADVIAKHAQEICA
jgi:legumain